MRKDWVEINFKLGTNILAGIGFPKNIQGKKNGSYPFYKVGDISNNVRAQHIYLKTCDNYVDEIDIPKIHSKLIPKDCIVFAKIGEALKLNRRAITASICLIDNNVIAIQPKKELLITKFLYLYLLTVRLEYYSRATTVPSVRKTDIEQILLQLPPLLEQKAIVAKIEQLFSELDNGIANLKAAQAKLKIYRQAVLKKAFSGELTKDWREKQTNLPTAEELIEQIKQEREEHYKQQLKEWQQAVKNWEGSNSNEVKPVKPKQKKVFFLNESELSGLYTLPANWAWSKLGNICKTITDGDHQAPPKAEYGVPFVIISNITNNKINFNNTKFAPISYYDSLQGYRKVLKGDILYSVTGSFGIPVLIDFDKKFVFQRHIALVRILNSMVQKYVYYLLLNQFTFGQASQVATGTAQKTVPLEGIRNFNIPLCSTEEQNQIVQEIESRLSVCDKIEETIEAALSKSEALRQSILKKAFEGRLLSAVELENIRNHPDYESAHALLTRIKQEKSQASQTPSQKQIIKPVVSTDIHAGLIAKIIKAHQDNGYMEKLSHVKCEKIAHLVEYHIGVALGREPVKDAAGPDDYPHLKKVEHRALKVGYFSIQQQPIGHSYLTGRNIDKAIKKFEESIDVSQNNKVNDLINLFLKFNLEQSEIVATLYAAWNNLLLAGKDPDDEEIVYEARENWSSRKLNIDRDRFFKALQWMRQKDISLVPSGVGLMVRKNS